MGSAKTLNLLARQVVACQRCPRLRTYCAQIGELKRRAYQDWQYWAKPVPGFGDPQASLLVIGLAPGAHGANRTGRMFTGDSSGDWLYRALHNAGFASQAQSTSRDDGLVLHGAYIGAAGRCAPPDNKPLREELERCREYLEREIDLLPRVRVVVTLGAIAHGTYLSILRDRALIPRITPFKFAHGAEYKTHADGPTLIASYHPSQQNTSTGKLTRPMLDAVFARARALS